MMTRIQKLAFVILFSIFYFLFSNACFAATLYLEPSQGEYQLGDTFMAEIKIDTEEECINTVEVELKFSSDILEAIDFSQGLSVLTLWVKPPEINQKSGRISFSGGIPGGYCGEIPGDPGPGHILGKIVLQASNKGEAKLNFLEGTQVLLNDGFGTPAKLTTKGAVFNILPEKLEVPKNEWQEEIGKDNISPEPFKIEIHQDPAIFEGKYFITFFTSDKQTGIDHFEISETRNKRQEIWEKRDSPYLLEDQSLGSIIKVKAVDKAGNERIAEYIPPKQPFSYWIIVLTLIGMGAIWWIIRKFRYGKK